MAEVNWLFRPEQYERQPNDFYPTPPEATQCLLETVPLRDFVWEPCAGQGLMAKTIADAGYRVIASDVVAYEGSVFPIITGIDALQAALPSGVQTVVTNPRTATCRTSWSDIGWAYCSRSAVCSACC